VTEIDSLYDRDPIDVDMSKLPEEDRLFFAARSLRAQGATELLYNGISDKISEGEVRDGGEDVVNNIYKEVLQEWRLPDESFYTLAEEAYAFMRRPKEDGEA